MTASTLIPVFASASCLEVPIDAGDSWPGHSDQVGSQGLGDLVAQRHQHHFDLPAHTNQMPVQAYPLAIQELQNPVSSSISV